MTDAVCAAPAAEAIDRAARPCLVVMQPTFLPWAGYFHLMAQADDFVFLDDVQLEKQSWQTRNRLVVAGEAHWVSVPVRHVALGQTIAATEVLDAPPWRTKLARSYAFNHARHPHRADGQEIIDALVDAPTTGLAELNATVIRFVAARLGLTPRLHRSSDLGVAGERSARLAALCGRLGAATYLSPVGSADYLAADGFCTQTRAALRFQSYTPTPYPQRGTAQFLSHLSIVDVVANLGWSAARRYVTHDLH